MVTKIDDIIVGERIRKEQGDMDSLVESIRQVGLLQPILVSPTLELLSGYRRLEACRRLEMIEIPIRIIEAGDNVHQLDLEYHENIGRENFTDEETVAYNAKRIELLTPPKKKFILLRWLDCIVHFITGLFRKKTKPQEQQGEPENKTVQPLENE